MAAPRVFFYVQHLLGIGHLKRGVTLARALNAAGLDVTLVCGGCEVPELAADDVRIIQLPAVAAADSSFKRLVDCTGRPIDAAWKQQRCEALLAAYAAAAPQVVLIELFPFGRRQMRFELLPLLDRACAARPRPLILSSVRDIGGGGQRDPARQRETQAIIERCFDAVLVHGDPQLVRFEQSFPLAGAIRSRIHHTGYVVEPISTRASRLGAGEVLVSAGGGAVGRALLETALRARPLTKLARRTWRLITGVNATPADAAMIRALAEETGEGYVTIERMRTDFTTLLKNCALSVSQAGYNTIMEILQVRARALVVPFAAGAETEQTMRAAALAQLGYLQVLAEDGLTPQALAQAIDRTAYGPPPPSAALDLNGAQTSARLIQQMLAEHR